MQMQRRAFLSSVSAVILCLFMPPAHAMPKPEGLLFIANRVHECLHSYSTADKLYLFEYCQRRTGAAMQESEWLSEEHVLLAVDRTMRVAFRAFLLAAQEEDFPIMTDGKLSYFGQVSVVEHLPISPADYGNKAFMDALRSCASYYLTT